MRLTTDDLVELPLPAVWMREDGRTYASTPEWTGAGAAAGAAQFRFGPLRLVVATGEPDTAVAALTARVLAELARDDPTVAPELGDVRRLLRAGLRLVLGAPDLSERPTNRIMRAVQAAAAEENVALRLGPGTAAPVRGGDTIGLSLKQLAVNARRHDAAEDLLLEVRGPGDFRLSWDGAGTPGPVRTSRHPDRRDRWGLGLARLAADALGATLVPVHDRPDGRAESALTLVPAANSLSLPLAAVDARDRVTRATRAWDEETSLPPGRQLTAELASLAVLARRSPGRIARQRAFAARAADSVTWMALVPRGCRDQGRDLVAGIVHETALVGDGTAGIRLRGCAQALSLALGERVPMWLPDGMTERLLRACAAFEAPAPLLEHADRPVPPAPLVAFLCAEGGGGTLSAAEDRWLFRSNRSSAVLDQLSGGGAVVIR